MQDRTYYINEAEGLGRVLNNKGLYVKMLSSFISKPYLEELLGAIEKGDFQAATLTAHSIKGVAANLSFPALYEKMHELESKLKNGETQNFDLDGVKETLETTLMYINEIIAENG